MTRTKERGGGDSGNSGARGRGADAPGRGSDSGVVEQGSHPALPLLL